MYVPPLPRHPSNNTLVTYSVRGGDRPMLHRILSGLLLSLTLCGSAAQAGLYYSGETFAELPSQWRGFLLDQRLLRQAAMKPLGNTPNPVRKKYEAAAEALAVKARDGKLTADECADLGALYFRLGEVTKAVDVLRKGQR